jgi:hypothetical protein
MLNFSFVCIIPALNFLPLITESVNNKYEHMYDLKSLEIFNQYSLISSFVVFFILIIDYSISIHTIEKLRSHDKVKKNNYWSFLTRILSFIIIISLFVELIMMVLNDSNLMVYTCIISYGQCIAVSASIGILIRSFKTGLLVDYHLRYSIISIFFVISQITNSYQYSNDTRRMINSYRLVSFLFLAFCIVLVFLSIANIAIVENIFLKLSNNSNNNISNNDSVGVNKGFRYSYMCISLFLFLVSKFIFQIVVVVAGDNSMQINIFVNIIFHVVFVVSMSFLSNILIQKMSLELNVFFVFIDYYYNLLVLYNFKLLILLFTYNYLYHYFRLNYLQKILSLDIFRTK